MSDSVPLPAGPWDLILADPPWQYNADHVIGEAEQHYPTMADEEIAAMPVRAVVAPNSVLVLWATWPKLDVALRVLDSWGFSLVTGLPWIKTYDGFKPFYGLGWWVRGCSEPILICRRGKVPPPDGRRLGLLGHGFYDDNQLGLLTAPRNAHSQKPSEIHTLCEDLCRDGRRLELFARRKVDGWETWGNEVS